METGCYPSNNVKHCIPHILPAMFDVHDGQRRRGLCSRRDMLFPGLAAYCCCRLGLKALCLLTPSVYGKVAGPVGKLKGEYFTNGVLLTGRLEKRSHMETGCPNDRR